MASIAGSGLVLDVLVGPAGTGKTRTLAALNRRGRPRTGRVRWSGWRPRRPPPRCSPTASGAACENTAKWLVELDAEPGRLAKIDRTRAALHAAPDPDTAGPAGRGTLRRQIAEVERWRFHPGQLVIVDEASLAGTLVLDRLAACAGEAGAKLLLVGDWAQLSSIEAGGAFGMLVRDRGTGCPELGTARRFTHAWERDRRRPGPGRRPRLLDAYARARPGHRRGHRRRPGRRHTEPGAPTSAPATAALLLAGDADTVRRAERARPRRARPRPARRTRTACRCTTGCAPGSGTGSSPAATTAGSPHRRRVGEERRHLDRHRTTRPGGGLTSPRLGGHGSVELPADYVAAHVDLGYATTAFRAQGATVDTAHAVVTPGMTREALYVMLTRGREGNHLYVDTEPAANRWTASPTRRTPAPCSPTYSAARRRRVRPRTADAEREHAASIRTLAAEYETLARRHSRPAGWACSAMPDWHRHQVATGRRFTGVRCPQRRFRDADARHLPVERALPRLVLGADRGADDLAAVLHARVDRWAVASTPLRPPELVCGLLPRPQRVEDPDLRRALDERADLIDARADQLLDRARAAHQPWVETLEQQHPAQDTLRAVAAHREMHAITDPGHADGKPAELVPSTRQPMRPVSYRGMSRDDRMTQAQVATRTRPPVHPSASPERGLSR